MRIGLLELERSFQSYRAAKSDFYGYPYYLYNSLKKIEGKAKIDRLGVRLDKRLGKGMSILSNTFFRDISKYDVVHNLDLNPFFPVNKGNASIVTTAHDFQFVLKPELNKDVSKGARNVMWLSVVTKLALKSTLQSDHLIAVSSLTKNDAVKLGYPGKKITVVNHGIADRIIKEKIPKKGNANSFTVGYIGALRTRKNPGMLISAFKRLKGKEYTLKVWGKLGYARNNAMESARSDNRIHFMGFAPEDKQVSIYDSFDVFVYPSFYEGFGIPILEAQARGLPVIIYKKGMVPIEVRKYCIEANDTEHMAALIEKLRENGYNEKRRMLALRYARGFTWRKAASNTLKVYEKMMR